MSNFHIVISDESPVSRLLYYSTKLYEDIKKANERAQKKTTKTQTVNYGGRKVAINR